ncbi:MAG: peptidase M20, partial [Thermoproteota archaeon]
DNKGNIISRIHAVWAFLSAIGEVPVNVKFFVEGEEEIGSPHLAPFVEEHKELLKADCGIWEFGGVDHEGRPNIWLGLKGILYVELRVRETAVDTHSSMAPIVPNAAWRLVWALNSLKSEDGRVLVEGFYDDVVKPTRMELELIERIPYPEEEVKKDLGLESFLKDLTGAELVKTLLLEPTCTICGLNSGYTGEGSKTVLPSTAMAKIDFRLVPNQRPKEILKKLREHLDKRGFNDVEIVVHGFLEPAKTPVEEDFVQLVIRAAEEVYQKEAVVYPTSAGSGPLYLFRNVLGIPMVSVGVGYPLSRAHAPNEHIRIKDYLLGTKLIARIISDLGARERIRA